MAYDGRQWSAVARDGPEGSKVQLRMRLGLGPDLNRTPAGLSPVALPMNGTTEPTRTGTVEPRGAPRDLQ
jgi:hypothetical protein